MLSITGADGVFPDKLAAAIGIDWCRFVLLDIRRALAPVEHVIGRDVNERNAAATGFGRKQPRRFGIDCERDRLFAFGPIDIGVTRSIDHRTPMLGRDYACDRVWARQIECGPAWCYDFNISGKEEGADLLTNLAGPTEQEETHSSRALLGEAAALVGVVCGQQRLPPGTVIEVPLHSRIEASFKRVVRRPTDLGIKLSKIDGVTEIVARAIGHEADELAMRRAVWLWYEMIHCIADCSDHIDIAMFSFAADVVRLAHAAAFQHQRQRLRMIIDKQPVAYIEPTAVDRHRLALESLDDCQRNKL